MRTGIFCTLDHHPDLQPSVAGLYRRALEEATTAEELGLESFWVAEHHFAAYGVSPDPAVLLATIAARTTRLRVGTATAVLPLHNPLRTAETYALVDQLSGGRLEFGVGSGYLHHEFAGFGIAPEEKRERFDEALAIIQLAWSGAPVVFAGRFHHFAAGPINVLPVLAGGPPIHVGLTRPDAAPHIGRLGLHLATVPYIALSGWSALAELIATYRAAVPPGQRPEVSVAMHVFCGPGPWHAPADPAYAQAEAALDRYLRTRVVPGARYAGPPVSRDFVLFGDPGQLAGRCAALEALGVDRLLLITSYGGIPEAEVLASLRRLAPVLQRLAADPENRAGA